MQPLEWCSIQKKEDVTCDAFQLFLNRFRLSLEEHAFPKSLAYAFAGAFGEMADNVVQHAELDRTFGLAGFYVVKHGALFTVADVGQGVLASLQKSAVWRHLSTSTDALIKAVQEGATRRNDAHLGSGFANVHRSLASHNGLLRFRSGDALLTLSGRSNPRSAKLSRVAPMNGFQISVQCSLIETNHNFLLAHFNE